MFSVKRGYANSLDPLILILSETILESTICVASPLEDTLLLFVLPNLCLGCICQNLRNFLPSANIFKVLEMRRFFF